MIICMSRGSFLPRATLHDDKIQEHVHTLGAPPTRGHSEVTQTSHQHTNRRHRSAYGGGTNMSVVIFVSLDAETLFVHSRGISRVGPPSNTGSYSGTSSGGCPNTGPIGRPSCPSQTFKMTTVRMEFSRGTELGTRLRNFSQGG